MPVTVERFEKLLTKTAPYMANSVNKGRTYSPQWEEQFEETLSLIFGQDEERMANAVKGYVRFALDATRLQKRFEKEGQYIAKTYAEAASAVYHNPEYMHNLYLPGILLSQFLWPHHFHQQQFFHKRFMPLVRQAKVQRFADIGIGTGFYSRLTLTGAKESTGMGFDISDSSLSYAAMQVEKFGLKNRWKCEKRNILTNPPAEKFPFIISVEVLEHLEDPVAFIKGLKAMLAPGGFGFVTAAITAPNEDHIYLYNNCDEVKKELELGGFEVHEWQEDLAYEPKAGEPVPRIGAFIVR
jgi:SAM-dependent methyltransferase